MEDSRSLQARQGKRGEKKVERSKEKWSVHGLRHDDNKAYQVGGEGGGGWGRNRGKSRPRSKRKRKKTPVKISKMGNANRTCKNGKTKTINK